MSLGREIANFIQSDVSKDQIESIFDGTFDLTSTKALVIEQRIRSYLELADSSALLLILQSLFLDRSNESIGLDKISFVATLPNIKLAGVKSTFLTIDNLLREAKGEVIGFGYEINDKDIIKSLHKCSSRNLQIYLACDKERQTGKNLFDTWPQESLQPHIFEDFRDESSAIYSKMHSKLILTDREKLLLTSANFTYHGMQGNIEFGVLLEGRLIGKIRNLLITLLNSKAFVRMT